MLFMLSCGTGGEHPKLEKSPKLFRPRAEGNISCRNVPSDYEHNGQECFFLDSYPEQDKYYECFYMKCKQGDDNISLGQKYVLISDDDLLMVFEHINDLQNSCRVWEDNKVLWLFTLKTWKTSQVD